LIERLCSTLKTDGISEQVADLLIEKVSVNSQRDGTRHLSDRVGQLPLRLCLSSERDNLPHRERTNR